MFVKYKQRKVDLQKATEDVEKATKLLEGLKNTISAYQRQGAVLLLEDLDEGLIKKLQSLTEDKIVIIFCKDGTRVEIKDATVTYTRPSGQIR